MTVVSKIHGKRNHKHEGIRKNIVFSRGTVFSWERERERGICGMDGGFLGGFHTIFGVFLGNLRIFW